MLNNLEKNLLQRSFPSILAIIFLLIIFWPAPSDWSTIFFVDHDAPFDYLSWRSFYINESNSRISSLALVSLLPNILISQACNQCALFFQSFVLKIAPFLVFIFFFSRKLTSFSSEKLPTWQFYALIFSTIFMIFFGLTGQMFINAGIFYNYLFQLNFYLFLWHFLAYLKYENALDDSKFRYLSLALMQSSIIIGSTVIPMGIYLTFIYFGRIRKTFFNVYGLLSLAGIIVSAGLFLYLSGLQNISLVSGVDEVNNFVTHKGYENLQGGYYYQFIGLSNWGIYTSWPDRLIGGFTGYYTKLSYQLPIVIINILAATYLYATKRYRVLLILIIFIILSAGSQGLFGEFFVWMIGAIPGFQSIRTPDNKFGYFTQAMFLLALFCSSSWYKNVIRNLVLLAFSFLIIITIVPILKGEVFFGLNSQFSPKSTFLVDTSYDKNLLLQVKAESFLLAVPGIGNIDHPSGRIGPIDPIFRLHPLVIAYSSALADSRSIYYEALKSHQFDQLKNIDVVLIRKSIKLIPENKLEDSGFKKRYEDEFTTLYSRIPQSIATPYSIKYLLYILLSDLAFFGMLGIFLYRFYVTK